MSKQDNHEAIDQWIKDQGLTMDALFVPFNHSRYAGGDWECINWSVVIRGRNGAVLTTAYAQGTGHIPGFTPAFRTTNYRDAAHLAIHEGKYRQGNGWPKSLPAPPLRDVLHSLVMDASAIGLTFDEWCAEYGQDNDSRKAEAAYRECHDIGVKLSRVIDLDEARERFQDY